MHSHFASSVDKLLKIIRWLNLDKLEGLYTTSRTIRIFNTDKYRKPIFCVIIELVGGWLEQKEQQEETGKVQILNKQAKIVLSGRRMYIEAQLYYTGGCWRLEFKQGRKPLSALWDQARDGIHNRYWEVSMTRLKYRRSMHADPRTGAAKRVPWVVFFFF